MGRVCGLTVYAVIWYTYAQSFGGNNLSKMRDFIYHSIVLTIIIGTFINCRMLFIMYDNYSYITDTS